MMWKNLTKIFKYRTTYEPTIPLPGIYPKETKSVCPKAYVHCNTSLNSFYMKRAQLCMRRRMNKEKLIWRRLNMDERR
jgi:hypothetical protein